MTPRPTGAAPSNFFEPEMNTRMRARRELEMDLRKALATEQFELHYQPLVVLETMTSPRSKLYCVGIIRRAG